jgi:hypothetical protein
MEITLAFILALIQVESAGNDKAVGDHGRALGPLQIHEACLEDVRRRYGVHYSHESMHDRDVAIWVCRKYLQMYCTEARLGRPVTLEDYAKCWNGGPNFFRKTDVVKARLEVYWKKVEAQL